MWSNCTANRLRLNAKKTQRGICSCHVALTLLCKVKAVKRTSGKCENHWFTWIKLISAGRFDLTTAAQGNNAFELESILITGITLVKCCPECIMPAMSRRSGIITWSLHPAEGQSGLTTGLQPQPCTPLLSFHHSRHNLTACEHTYTPRITPPQSQSSSCFCINWHFTPYIPLLLLSFQICSSLPFGLLSFSSLPRT